MSVHYLLSGEAFGHWHEARQPNAGVLAPHLQQNLLERHKFTVVDVVLVHLIGQNDHPFSPRKLDYALDVLPW